MAKIRAVDQSLTTLTRMQRAAATFCCVRKSEQGSLFRAEWTDCVPKFVINLAPKCIKSAVLAAGPCSVLCCRVVCVIQAVKVADFQANGSDNTSLAPG